MTIVFVIIIELEEDEQDYPQAEIGLQAYYLQFPDPYTKKLVTLELDIPLLFEEIMAGKKKNIE